MNHLHPEIPAPSAGTQMHLFHPPRPKKLENQGRNGWKREKGEHKETIPRTTIFVKIKAGISKL